MLALPLGRELVWLLVGGSQRGPDRGGIGATKGSVATTCSEECEC